MSFKLEDYEQVDVRLAHFHENYPDGRVITEMVSQNGDTIMFVARLYRNFEEEKAWATGYAEETKGMNNPVNKHSHVENCETSAIGRALANAGYAPKGKRPSREEMTKVQIAEENDNTAKPIDKPIMLDGSESPEPTKDVVIKSLYSRLYKKGFDAPKYAPKVAAYLGHGTLSACDIEAIGGFGAKIKDMEANEIEAMINGRAEEINDAISSAMSTFDN